MPILQPGVETPSVANYIELVRVNSSRRINISLLTDAGVATDVDESVLPNGDPAGELSVEITTLMGEASIFTESYWPNPVPDTRRLKRAAPGNYYFTLGESNIAAGDNSQETANTGTFVGNWHARTDAISEDVYRTQVIEIVSPHVLALLPRLRLMLDKSLKVVVPSQQCYLGYTDGQLVLYLRSAVEYINSFQPYVQFQLEMFPSMTHGEILLQAAMYIALQSQLNFSIDTDVPSFSDSGHSFVLQHVQPISAYVSQLRTELENRIPKFKLHFVRSGTISVELKPDYAFAALMSAAPWGSVFKNMFVAR